MENERFQELVLKQLQVLTEGQSRLELRLDSVDSRLGQVESRLDSVDSRPENVEKGQLKIETRLENEVIEKIRALFDDREVQNAKLEQIIAREDNISADINYLVSRVVRLEKMAK